MNRILASFTSSERNIITFVLLMAASGYGLLQWRDDQQSTMTFSAGPKAAEAAVPAPEKVLPPGMDVDGKIDINTADQQLLETLPGVGPSLAGAIMRHREEHGGFVSMSDVDTVPGIGPAMMAKLSPLVAFGDAAPVAPPTGLPPAVGLPPPAIPPGSFGDPVNSMVPGIPAGLAGQDGAIGGIVNINSAGAAELDTLKGVGPALAQRIIQERMRGAFRSVEDITRVRGIGPKILQDNRHRLSVQ